MITVYFLHGHAVAMHPAPNGSYYEARQQIYSCDVVVCDGKQFNLHDKRQIYAIPIPQYDEKVTDNDVANELGPTGYLEYILRMKASQYKNLGDDDLAYACLGQANKLMLYSDMGWPEKDYWRIVEWLEKDGRFGLAERWENWIHENVPTLADLTVENFRKTMERCKELGTGLIQFSWAGAQCGVVSKYQGRVYSIPGWKSKFPVLPTFIINTGCIIPQQACGSVYPFHLWNDPKLDTIYYKNKECPALRTSWRPFVDDRSVEEKQSYYDRMFKILEKEHKENNRRLYLRLRYAFPDLCPERLNTFYGWVKSKPDKYNEIINAAKNADLSIPVKEFQMPDDIEPPDPDSSYKGGRLRPFFL